MKKIALLPALSFLSLTNLICQTNEISDTVSQDVTWQWSLEKTNCPKAWDISRGDNIIVAVIGTGVDYTHVLLKDRMWKNENGAYGYNFVGSDKNDPKDYNGSGTLCAGLISANALPSKGIQGVAPKSKIMAIKIVEEFHPVIQIDIDYFVRALRYAADHGAHVICNTWATPFKIPEGSKDREKINEAVSYAYSKGCIIVTPAGDNDDGVAYYSPASNPNVIAVAATDKSDKRWRKSNYGAEIAIAAPGDNLLSTFLNNQFMTISGTRASCAQVAGTVALMLSADERLSFEEIKYFIRKTGDPISDTLNIGKRLNIYNALRGVYPITACYPEVKMITGVIEAKDTLKLARGFRYIFNNLTIRDKGVLELTDKPQLSKDEKWWLERKKFAIVEVKGDLFIQGKVIANDWTTPDKIYEMNVKECVQILDSIYYLIARYKFGKGGDGGYGGYHVEQPVFGVGARDYGGGGGGGFGYNNVPGYPAGTAQAPEVNGHFGGKPANGYVNYEGYNYEMSGGKGGDGGLLPDHGVGGLVVIICRGDFGVFGEIIMKGKNGENGKDGYYSNPVQLGTSFINGGGGGGGGGSAGLPSGSFFLFSKKNINPTKVIIEASKGGEPGTGRNNIVLTAHPGQPGKKGDDGKPGKFECFIIK